MCRWVLLLVKADGSAQVHCYLSQFFLVIPMLVDDLFWLFPVGFQAWLRMKVSISTVLLLCLMSSSSFFFTFFIDFSELLVCRILLECSWNERYCCLSNFEKGRR